MTEKLLRDPGLSLLGSHGGAKINNDGLLLAGIGNRRQNEKRN